MFNKIPGREFKIKYEFIRNIFSDTFYTWFDIENKIMTSGRKLEYYA